MALRRRASLLLALIAMPAFTSPARSQAPSLAPGQIWSVASPTTTTAKVIIGRIESLSGATVVHVSIIDVPIPAGAPSAGGLTTIGHIPFQEAALAASLGQLLGTDAAVDPFFKEGLRQWREAEGGYFTISVAEAIDLVFVTIDQPDERKPR
jgi:hypothetical protein